MVCFTIGRLSLRCFKLSPVCDAITCPVAVENIRTVEDRERD